MLRFFPGEAWKEIPIQHKLKFRYAASNYGRVMSFTDTFEDGELRKLSKIRGRDTFRYKVPEKQQKKGEPKSVTWYMARLVAELFLDKPSPEHKFVCHLDHNSSNNYYKNLRWMTSSEIASHTTLSPGNIAARQRLSESPRQQGHKLNTTQIIRIKKMLFDPNRRTRMKLIAKQFGISEMQLYRIKSGENWGHVKVAI